MLVMSFSWLGQFEQIDVTITQILVMNTCCLTPAALQKPHGTLCEYPILSHCWLFSSIREEFAKDFSLSFKLTADVDGCTVT
jgi:hypothetical protein